MENNTYFYSNFLGKETAIEYVTDKEKSIDAYIKYMVIRLMRMFKYENLPKSIPREMLEYYLLINGTCIIAKDEKTSQLVALFGHCGGELDGYYRPTIYTVGNPGFGITKSFNLGSEAILMRNDSLWLGLYPLMSRYGTMLAENTITMRLADIMLRIMAMLTAPDDKSKIAAEAYLAKLEKGELGAIAENRFLDGIKMQSPPSNNGSYLTQFIELHQYLLGSFYNEIGLNANFNMKREAIGEGESSLNEDSLLPLCEEMLRCRKEDIEKVNNLFGTEITVEFDSSWANNIKEIDLRMAHMEKEASQLENGDTPTEEEVTEEEVTEEEVTEEQVTEEQVTEENATEEEGSEDDNDEPVEEEGDDEDDETGSSNKDSNTDD